MLCRYTPDAKSEAPRWTYALCGLGLFIYQSLDAIDGKQARRTGTSSPLGELFDHGCDSISTVFVALSACAAVQLGQYPTWMFFQVCDLIPMYMLTSILIFLFRINQLLYTVLVFLCNDTVLLCTLANIRLWNS